jgi:hypothetical protein
VIFLKCFHVLLLLLLQCIDKAKRELGYQPVDQDPGFKATIASYKEAGYGPKRRSEREVAVQVRISLMTHTMPSVLMQEAVARW